MLATDIIEANKLKVSEAKRSKKNYSVTFSHVQNGNLLKTTSDMEKQENSTENAAAKSGSEEKVTLSNLFPGSYFRDSRWAIKGVTEKSDRHILVTPNMLSCTISPGLIVWLDGSRELDLNNPGTYDRTSVTDWSLADNRAGKQFYIFAYDDLIGTIKLVVSDNAIMPKSDGESNIYCHENTRRIASFHCLCESVGEIEGHPLSGFETGDILPQSVSDLLFQPDCVDISGMVYDPKGRIWVDIYLASGIGALTASVFNGEISDDRTWMDFVDDFGTVGKMMLTEDQFQLAANGSNEGTNIKGSKDPVTTGGHQDTRKHRMISHIGCEDMCGAMYQWLKTSSGSSEYILAGGYWYRASDCGSRFRDADYSRWYTNSHIGGRGAARSRNSN